MLTHNFDEFEPSDWEDALDRYEEDRLEWSDLSPPDGCMSASERNW